MYRFAEHLNITECCDHQHGNLLPEWEYGRPQESHAEREILLVLEGNMEFFLAGKYQTAAPGKAFFIDSWVPHQIGYGKLKNSIVHIWVHLHAHRLFAMPYVLGEASKLQSCGMWEFPEPMRELINLRWNQARQAPEELRQSLYDCIIRMLCEEIVFQSKLPANAEKSEDDITSWVKNYVSMNYGRNSSMEELERLTGYNRRHLMRKFKSESSMTIGEYINCVRRGFIAAAGKRLTQKEIAFQLGFKSPAAFWLWQKRDRERFGKND